MLRAFLLRNKLLSKLKGVAGAQIGKLGKKGEREHNLHNNTGTIGGTVDIIVRSNFSSAYQHCLT